MIQRVWLQIFTIILLTTVPLLVGQHFQQRESLNLLLSFQESEFTQDIIEQHLLGLKKLANLDPTNVEKYKSEFEEIENYREDTEATHLIRQNIANDLNRQSLRNALLILASSFVASILISRRIVKKFEKLADEAMKSSLKLENLRSLATWQEVAKSLVHELRAPITPIKLVASGLKGKLETLPTASYAQYVEQGTALIAEQVDIIERMIESFVQFAKLPQAQLRDMSIVEVTKGFVEAYTGFSTEFLTLRARDENVKQPMVRVDPELLQRLFFNLMRNALEANRGRKIDFTLLVTQDALKTMIKITNSGSPIPNIMVQRLFDPRVSRKTDSGGINMGLGLAICKKIALDHGGDLILVENSKERGVTFQLELPFLRGKS